MKKEDRDRFKELLEMCASDSVACRIEMDGEEVMSISIGEVASLIASDEILDEIAEMTEKWEKANFINYHVAANYPARMAKEVRALICQRYMNEL